MNWKHLLYIIPICLIIGAWAGLYFMGNMIDMTMTYATEKAINQLEDAHLAWQEKPLSDKRVMVKSEYCYMIDGSVACPKRNLTNFSMN